jgi:hypothetical protein
MTFLTAAEVEKAMDVNGRKLFDRLQAADMLTRALAAKHLKISEHEVEHKTVDGLFFTVKYLDCGVRYPAWQFRAEVKPWLRWLIKHFNLPGSQGWFLMNFMEQPNSLCGGRTPLVALEQGLDGAELMKIAQHVRY